MGKILALLVLCIMLFGGGLAGSLYLRSQQQDETSQADPGAEGDPPSAPGVELPVAMHSRPVSADEVFRFAASIRGRERELESRQETVEQHEARLKMMQDDIRGQRQEIEGLLGKLQDTLDRSNAALKQVKDERRLLQQDKTDANRQLQQAELNRQQMDASERENIKRFAGLLSNSPPARAADYLANQISIGNLQTAALLLDQMEVRSAAKILDEFQDPAVANKLADEFMKIERTPKKRR